MFKILLSSMVVAGLGTAAFADEGLIKRCKELTNVAIGRFQFESRPLRVPK